MSEDTRSQRLLVVGGLLVAIAMVLPVSVVIIGFYYFARDEVIPPAIDLVQVIMLWSAAASGATGIILIVLQLVRAVSRRISSRPTGPRRRMP